MVQLTQKSLSSAVSHRSRWWRFRLIPLTVWILAVIIGLMLSSRKVSELEVLGIVETKDVPVAALRDGIIQELLVDIYDPVQKDQNIALLEDTSLRAEFLFLEADLRRLRFEWEKKMNEREKNAVSPSGDSVILKLNELKAQLDYSERNLMKEIDKYNQSRLGMLLERQKRLVDEGIEGARHYEALKLEINRLSGIIKSHEEVMDILKESLREARSKISGLAEPSNNPAWIKWVQAWDEELKKTETRLKNLLERKNTLEIKAPLSGSVSRIFLKTGDSVLSGNPILTIVGGSSVKAVAYVKEDQFLDIAPGFEAKVFSRIRPDEKCSATVLKVGPQMVEIPMRLRRITSVSEWGLPVVIGSLPFEKFRPGEMVDIRISGKPAKK